MNTIKLSETTYLKESLKKKIESDEDKKRHLSGKREELLHLLEKEITETNRLKKKNEENKGELDAFQEEMFEKQMNFEKKSLILKNVLNETKDINHYLDETKNIIAELERKIADEDYPNNKDSMRTELARLRRERSKRNNSPYMKE